MQRGPTLCPERKNQNRALRKGWGTRFLDRRKSNEGWATRAGKYKNGKDVQAHVDKLTEGMKAVDKAIQGVKTAVGQKARDAAKEVLEKATALVKGHEKDLRQKPQIKAKEENP